MLEPKDLGVTPCQSLDKSITENKEKKPNASIDEKGVWRFSLGREAERQSYETGHWKNLY